MAVPSGYEAKRSSSASEWDTLANCPGLSGAFLFLARIVGRSERTSAQAAASMANPLDGWGAARRAAAGLICRRARRVGSHSGWRALWRADPLTLWVRFRSRDRCQRLNLPPARSD